MIPDRASAQRPTQPGSDQQWPDRQRPRHIQPAAGPDYTMYLVRRARRRWVLVAIVALLSGAAVYWFSVQTVTGQTIENAALRGTDQADPERRQTGVDYMGLVTLSSVAVATLVVATIGLLRRQPVLAAAGVSIIAVGQAITQILKHFVLPRPDLALVAAKHTENTLPSGHTTVAMTLLFALLLVVPYRYRGIAMFFALTWAVGMGAFTIVAKAHRLSDTLAADAVALVVACAASYLLARTGRIRAVVSPGAARYTLRTVFVVVTALVGAAGLAVGILMTAAAWYHRPIRDVAEWNLFVGAQSLALAGSVIAALVFWATWYRLEAKRRDDPQMVV